MIIFTGSSTTIELTADEVDAAIHAYLNSRGVLVSGPKVVKINDQPCRKCSIHVGPNGSVKVKGDDR